jgi:hypothetical protein
MTLKRQLQKTTTKDNYKRQLQLKYANKDGEVAREIEEITSVCYEYSTCFGTGCNNLSETG